MRRRLLASLLVLSVASVVAEEKTATAAGQEAAIAWLALADSGKYGESWDQGAEIFKKGISRERWEAALSEVRRPLGPVKSRSLASATFTTSLPSAPAGQYVVVQFKTSFAEGPERTETVTPMRDPDGKWRVAGYFIR